MSTIPFARRVRRQKPAAPGEEIEIQPPPAVPENTGGGISSVLMYAPMGLGSIAMVMMFVRPGSGLMTYIGGGMMLLSVVGMLIVQLLRGSVTHKQKLHGHRRDYIRYLAQLRVRVRRSLKAQQRAARWIHPDPRALWSIALGYRLWERRPAQDDFGEVRLGLGTQRSATKLLPPDTKPVEDLEPLAAHALRRFLRAYSTLSDTPIAVYLRGFGQIQFAGDDKAVLDLVRALLGQLVTAHAPGDVRIALCAAEDRVERWDWLKWLPHNQDPESRDAAGARRLVADGVAEIELLLGGPAFTGRPRFEADTPITASEPYVVLLLDGVAVPSDHRVADEGYRNAVVLDVSGSLPWQQRPGALFLEVEPETVSTVSFDRLGRPQSRPLCAPDALGEAAAAALARTMARYRVGEVTEDDEPMAADYDLAGLLGLGDVAHFDPRQYRRERMTAKRRLRVPIGIAGNGTPLELDIKEAAEDGMGPHGLCVGATGSGKSELLRTLVLALATTHSSEELNFVLVDFKGGATFLGLDGLTHVSAVITNLADELPLVDRMRDALNGELVRRQELLRTAGNFASLRDYTQAREKNRDMKHGELPPVPTLFVVIDEFSELLSARPEFIDLFVMIGRLGRSLGVHLLLASQRLEEGKLRGLDTHLSYRIGLRTFSAAESRVVLGVPDAYELPPQPGSGYLKFDVGPMTRFKAAYVSGPASTGPVTAPQRRVKPEIVPYGPGYVRPDPDAAPPPRLEPRAESVDSLLDVVVAQLAGHGAPAHQIWLPPLDVPPTLDQLLPPLAITQRYGCTVESEEWRGRLRAVTGIVDRPFDQRSDPMWADLSAAAGHAAVVGAPQSGKSTMLRTLICSLALLHTPREVQFYCLDFGGGSRSGLATLPHAGGVASRLDPTRVRRTVAEVQSLLARREKEFADQGIESIAAYRRMQASGEVAGDGYGDVFLVVDGWLTLRQDFEQLEQAISAVAARGLGYGVHVLASAGKWSEFRPALRDLFGTRLELRLGDPYESEIDRRLAASVPEGSPGRGITREGLHFLTALPRIDSQPNADSLADGVRKLAEAVAVAWPGEPAPRVRLLPEVLPMRALPGVTQTGTRIPIGIDESTLAPVQLDFGADAHFLVFGDTECGKSNLLRLIAESVVERYLPDQARLIFIDYRRSLLDSAETEHRIGYAASSAAAGPLINDVREALAQRLPPPDLTPAQLRSRSWWEGSDLFLLVDDYDLVAGVTNPLLPIADLIPQARDIGLHLIVARSAGGAGRAMFDPVIQRIREMGSPGLIMSGSRDEGSLLGSVRPQAQPPGRGVFVERRTGSQLIQTALLDDGSGPVPDGVPQVPRHRAPAG